MSRIGRARPVPHRLQGRNAALYAKQGSLTLTAGASLSLTGSAIPTGALTMSAAGTLVLDGTLALVGALTMDAAATLTAANVPWKTGVLALTAAGTLALDGTRLKPILLVSIASAAGTDAFGNVYPAGLGVFDNGLIEGSTIKTTGSTGGLFVYAGDVP